MTPSAERRPAGATAAVAETAPVPGMTCRFCGHAADHLFVDLGMSPLCESFLSAEQLNQMEPFYPLRVQRLPELLPGATGRIRQPVGTSSPSTPTSRRTRPAGSSTPGPIPRPMRQRLDLTEKSLVIEIASNDGYLLQHFVKAGIPVLGHRAGRERRRGGAREGCADPLLLLRHRHGTGAGRARANRPICWSATTCWRTFPI